MKLFDTHFLSVSSRMWGLAVNFAAVGDGFCVTDERSVDPGHSTRAAAKRLSAAVEA